MDKRGVSNNTLAVLLVLSIFVSLTGTWYGFNRLPGLAKITGAPTATTQLSVTNTTALSLPTSSIDFGSIGVGAQDDTSDGTPAPFNVQNDGNVPINITINASLFFGSTRGANASSYQFKCRANEGPNCPTGSPTSYTNMPTANDTGKNLTTVFDLPSPDTNDSRFVDIAVSVPSDELGGSKSSTVTFVATQI
ncbi:hypothetical protein HYS48_00165 [Candidatus Woesearchaeota archaeon]|nr:hypothetical protein [Candidatus Woesearchaeota archaeon]